MDYNGWSNWDTWESFNISASNDEETYIFMKRRANTTFKAFHISLNALIKQHNKKYGKLNKDLIINKDLVNFKEVWEAFLED